MTLETSKISDYIKNNAEIFIKQVLFKFSSAENMRVRPGIKHKETFGRIATDAVFKAASCGWNPAGVTQLDDIELGVTKFEIKENVCQQTLDDTYYNLLGQAGSLADDAEFNLEKEYVDAKIAKVQDGIERLVWRGKESLGINNPLGQFDGLVERIMSNIPDARTGNVTAVADVADQPYVEVTIDAVVALENGQDITIAGTTDYNGTFEIHNACTLAATSTFYIRAAFTSDQTGTWTEVQDSLIAKTASGIDDFYTMADSLDDEFMELPDLKYYLEPKDFRALTKEIINIGGSGNYNIDLTKPTKKFMFPGEEVEVVRTMGLSGEGKRIMTYKDNLWFGTDLISDYETVKFFYDEGEDTHKFMMKMKGGTQVAHAHMVAVAQ